MKRSIICASVCIIGLSLATNVSAATVTWVGDGDGTSFDDPDNWSNESDQPGVPSQAAGDTVLLNDDQANAPVNGVTFAGPGSATGSYQSFVVDARFNNAQPFEFEQTGGTIDAEELAVGDFGFGSYAISGGTLNVTDPSPTADRRSGRRLTLGREANSFGELTVNGGRINADELLVAGGGDGKLVLNDGLIALHTLTVADDNLFGGSEGGVEQNGGEIFASFASIGSIGRAFYTQTAGTNNFGLFILGGSGLNSGGVTRASGIGTYTLDGGTLNTGVGLNLGSGVIAGSNPPIIQTSGPTIIGGFGKGQFAQNGGTHNVLGVNGFFDLEIGAGSNAGQARNLTPEAVTPDGAYFLFDGLLDVRGNTILGTGRDFVSSTGNGGGVGFFVQSGGTHRVRKNLIVGQEGSEGNGLGDYALSGGDLIVDGDVVLGSYNGGGPNTAEGVFEQTGGTVNAAGRLFVSSIGTYSVIGQNARTTFGSAQIGGQQGPSMFRGATLRVGDGGRFFATQGIDLLTDGTISGDAGTIIGRVNVNGGRLAPGNSPGTLNIDGDLTFASIASILEIEIAGDGPGDFDVLNITGDLIADNGFTLELSFLNGYTPELGDSFNFLNVGGVSSLDFAMINVIVEGLGDNFGFSFDFVDGMSSLIVSSVMMPPNEVPIPGAIPLFLTGLAGLGWRRRQKKN